MFLLFALLLSLFCYHYYCYNNHWYNFVTVAIALHICYMNIVVIRTLVYYEFTVFPFDKY